MKTENIAKIFVVLVILGGFANLILFSDSGFYVFSSLKTEIAKKEKNVATLENEVRSLKKEIDAWQHDKFYLEKMAREELLMGRSNELIFVMKDSHERK